MAGCRVEVDLGDYFSDYRQKSLIFIDRGHIESVQDLKNHICEVFSLVDDFEIFISDAHVPRSEHVHVINKGDVIKIQKVTGQPDVREDPHETKSETTYSTSHSRKKKKRSIHCVHDKISKCSLTERLLTKDNSCQTEAYDCELPKKKKKKQKKEDEEVCESLTEIFSGKIVTQNAGSLINGPATALTAFPDPDEVEEIAETHLEEHSRTRGVDHCSMEKILRASTIDAIRVGIPEKSLLKLSPVGQSEASCKVEDGTWCESLDPGMRLGSVKKRRRKRAKKKRESTSHIDKCTSYSSGVPPVKTVHKTDESLLFGIRKRKDASISNNHIRFSDEDHEKITEKPPDVEIVMGGVPDITNIFVNSEVCEKAFQVKELIIENSDEMEEGGTVETPLKNKEEFRQEIQDTNRKHDEYDPVCSRKDDLAINLLGFSDNDKESKVFGMTYDSETKEKELEVVIAGSIEVSSEAVPSTLKAELNVFRPKNSANRRKNMAIMKGVGATIAQLMKERNNLAMEKGDCKENNPSEAPVRPHMIATVPGPQQPKKDRQYRGFPVLEKFPRMGDVLAFKILKLNESYEPAVSGYLEGKVTACDDVKTSVTIKVLGGEDELKKINGKFEIQEEGDGEPKAPEGNNEEVTLSLQWSEFIEPRLIFP